MTSLDCLLISIHTRRTIRACACRIPGAVPKHGLVASPQWHCINRRPNKSCRYVRWMVWGGFGHLMGMVIYGDKPEQVFHIVRRLAGYHGHHDAACHPWWPRYFLDPHHRGFTSLNGERGQADFFVRRLCLMFAPTISNLSFQRKRETNPRS